MNKRALVFLCGITIFHISHAQSTVTLYGLIDVGILFNNNSAGAKQYVMSSGNQQGSRWGLRVVEDLGSGLSTVAVLENGFSTATGTLLQGGDEFGRQAYVGISSSNYGTLTFGRQYDSVLDYVSQFASSWQFATAYGGHPGDLDNMLSNRVNNAIKFRSALYSGFSFDALYSLGGKAGQFNRNQIYSVGAGYTNGPVALGVGYVNAQDPNYSYWGNNALSSTTGTNMGGSLVFSGYASAKTQQNLALGGSYAIGLVTVAAQYTNVQFNKIGSEPGLPATGASGSAKFNTAELNIRYLITPALLVGLSYALTKGYDVNHSTYQQSNVGIDYFLSKRTDLYLVGIYQHASGVDSTGKTARANIELLSPSSNSNQLAALAGIRFKF